jgi:uncharacterized protein DUF5135
MAIGVDTRSGSGAARPVAKSSSGKPVKVWAWIGGLILAFQIYIWAKWITGPNFERVPTGPDDPPAAMKAAIVTTLAIGVVLAGFCIWHFVVRPWRRDGQLSLDGMFTIAFGLCYFQDPLFNYSGTWLTYNSWMPNMGSWLPEIPGSVAPAAPGAQFAESPLWVLPLFVYILLPVCMLTNWVMRRARGRWPSISTFGLVMIAWAFCFVFTLVLEAAVLMPMGFYTYAGAFADTSVNPSHYYKYPVYEALIWGALWAAWASLRFFRNDRGETLAERGIANVKATPGQKSGIRFLAVFGAVSVAFLCVYNIPAQYMGPRAQPFPKDVQERSYFLNGLCGNGTAQACAELDRAGVAGLPSNPLQASPNGPPQHH